jgi:hypothetical protein
MQNARKIIAEIIVSIAFIMLVAYIADVAVSMANETGFIPLSAKDRGMILGGGSIILFIISFIIGINVKSRILTTLLIIGGAIMGTAVVVSTYILPAAPNVVTSSEQVTPNLPQFVGIIVIGYAIMGLGILRAIRKK